MGLCLIALGLLSIGIGIVVALTTPRLMKNPRVENEINEAFRTRGAPRPEQVRRPVGAFAPPVTQTPVGEKKMDNSGWEWIKVGSRVLVSHRTRGDLTLYVLGEINFEELWQQGRGANLPWISTGNTYHGYWCEQNILLLNWQTRYYVLDERDLISDVEIQRHFADRAREFGQSDQKADVYVAYPPTTWHLDDIGRFRVAQVSGDASHFNRGAEGRFIHGSSTDGRGLVVEDYISGGGQDSAWIGLVINKEDVKQA